MNSAICDLRRGALAIVGLVLVACGPNVPFGGTGSGSSTLGGSESSTGSAQPAGDDSTSTSGDTAWADSSSGDTAWGDVSSEDGTEGSSTGASGDQCAAHVGVDLDPEQPCGLVRVDFETNSSSLTDGAICRLDAAAACIAETSGVLYLEAHAAADEGSTEEEAILLSQARGASVSTFLTEAGVPSAKTQVIAKGNLRAQQPAAEEDQRVELLWDTSR